MARGVNKVILVGNLGADPETRSMPSGMTVTNIRIATSESWKDKTSGAQQERTEWHSVALFGRLGEIAAEYLRKGSQVFIEGKLRTRKWQDKQGNDRYTTEIIADNMQMLGGRVAAARRRPADAVAAARRARSTTRRRRRRRAARESGFRRRYSVLVPGIEGPCLIVGQVLAREQRLGKAEHREVAYPARIQDAVQVIHLMLDDARMKIAHGALDQLAVGVEAAVMQFAHGAAPGRACRAPTGNPPRPRPPRCRAASGPGCTVP